MTRELHTKEQNAKRFAELWGNSEPLPDEWIIVKYRKNGDRLIKEIKSLVLCYEKAKEWLQYYCNMPDCIIERFI